MQITIKHTEKKTGMVFKKTHYGVETAVTFNEEEKAIIESRKLQFDCILERGAPSDVDPDKHEERGLGKKLLTAAVKGRDANNFNLTINKLMKGPDVFWFTTPAEAKNYEAVLKSDSLPGLKGWLTDNAETGGSDSFEL
ncbi:MAG: hypothetical protein ACU0A2_06015 [Cognatishimia sp.]|uniref:hypothetical protein n=1 Tax=Cognatishimia sp. TaxID=2211648 RepID=UPI0040597770